MTKLGKTVEDATAGIGKGMYDCTGVEWSRLGESVE